jgi:nicotinamidase-related amidase
VRRQGNREPMEIAAEPYPFVLTPERCALLIIDMQRDFLEPGGFGELLGNDVSQLRRTIGGEPGHDLIPELYPEAGEPVVDKPGKGAFYATDLHEMLQHRGVKQLVVTGVTTEVCVNTTVREANDRGYDCLVLEDCVGSYFPEFHEMGLKMIKAQGGIFGWVTTSEALISCMA